MRLCCRFIVLRYFSA